MIKTWEYQIFLKEDWVSLVFLGIILLFVFIKIQFPYRYEGLLKNLSIKKYIMLYNKDSNKIIASFNILMLLIFCAIVSLYIYLFASHYNSDFIGYKNYLNIYGATLAFILIRYITLRFFCQNLKIDSFLEHFVFQTLTYQYRVAFLCLPLIAIYYYSFLDSNLILLNVGGLFIAGVLITHIIIFIKNSKLLLKNLRYFLLFVTAFRVAPYFIIYQYFLNIN